MQTITDSIHEASSSSKSAVAIDKGHAAAHSGKSAGAAPSLPIFAIVFYTLITAMNTRQDTVLAESKQLSYNALAQNDLNKQNGEIHFSMLPPNATQNQITQIQNQNEEYAAQRSNIQNSLITERQNAQVTMTRTTTDVNILEQDASEDSGWLKTLNTVFQVIDEITGSH